MPAPSEHIVAVERLADQGVELLPGEAWKALSLRYTRQRYFKGFPVRDVTAVDTL